MDNKSGNPIFDIRQEISIANINDENISISKLKHHDFGGGPDSQLRIIEKILVLIVEIY